MGRESQIQQIRSLFDCGTEDCRPPVWTTVTGGSGTGKTTVVRKTLETMEGCSFVVVSLAVGTTLFGCLNLILENMDLAATVRNGIDSAFSRIREGIRRKLLEEKYDKTQLIGSSECLKRLVLVLDDFDTIQQKADDHHTSISEVVTKLLGLVETLQNDGCRAGIVAIMNNPLEELRDGSYPIKN